MEDILDVYKQPYDPQYPQVCLDEMSTQLIGEVRAPLPAQPGQPLRYDTEYKRNGTANIFIAFEPLIGQRMTKVTEQRTKTDWAHFIQELIDQHYPHVEKIRLVMDNLNTHTKAALYEAFEPSEAKRIADKLDIHYTPKHGSWLNVSDHRGTKGANLTKVESATTGLTSQSGVSLHESPHLPGRGGSEESSGRGPRPS